MSMYIFPDQIGWKTTPLRVAHTCTVNWREYPPGLLFSNLKPNEKYLMLTQTKLNTSNKECSCSHFVHRNYFSVAGPFDYFRTLKYILNYVFNKGETLSILWLRISSFLSGLPTYYCSWLAHYHDCCEGLQWEQVSGQMKRPQEHAQEQEMRTK